MFSLIKKMFIQPTPIELAERAITNAKCELLHHDSSAIYHKKMAEYYQECLTAVERRLNTF